MRTTATTFLLLLLITSTGYINAAAQIAGSVTIPTPRPPTPAPQACVPVDTTCGALHWDFEDHDGDGRGDLYDWTGTGDFLFDTSGHLLQPTFADNVSLQRILASMTASDPSPLRSLRTLLDMGGDYWNVGWPTGYQGNFWLGSFERRPTSDVPPDTTAGDHATGDLISSEFALQRSFIKFLASGTCGADVGFVLEERATRRLVVDDCTTEAAAADRAALAMQNNCPGASCASYLFASTTAQNALSACMSATPSLQDVAAPAWEPVRVFNGWRNQDPHQPIYIDFRFVPGSSSGCSEIMKRVSWSTAIITNRGETASYRLRIYDHATNGHVSVDDVWVTNRTDVPEPTVPLAGFADLHTHPAAHLGFGSLLFAGTPAGSTGAASWPRSDTDFWSDMDAGCSAYASGSGQPADHGGCHNTSGYGLTCNTDAAPQVIAQFTDGGRHTELRPYWQFARDGYSAPSWYNGSHQMMHVNWLRRAFEGGMRLLVADAVNNRPATWLLEADPGHSPPMDTDAIEKQYRYLTALANANASWMEIVLSPSHARRVIAAGKLAIVLGTEVDAFGECNSVNTVIRESGANVPVTTRCNWSTVLAKLDEFEALGQRKINPVHFADNGFGGMAVYRELFVTSNNWLNRGDMAAICDDPRFPASLCASSPIPRDVDNTYPLSVLPGFSASSPPSNYRQIVGWPQLRDATALLGARGFTLAASQAYLTITNVPLLAGYYANPATYDVLLPGYNGRTPAANVLGLTDTGRALVRELMRRGMLIDVQHMSERAVNEILGLVDPALGAVPGRGGASGSALLTQDATCSTLGIAALDANPSCKDGFYPVMSSHGGVRFISGIDPAYITIPDGQNENARSLDQIRRIYQIGGTVGIGTVGGTEAFGHAYLSARSAAGDVGIAAGSDFNGGDAGAPPRLLQFACMSGDLPDASQSFVRYRLAAGASEPTYRSAICNASGSTIAFSRTNTDPVLKPLTLPGKPGMTTPAPFDINTDGFANIGMYPDYLQDLRANNMGRDQMRALLRSAERTLQQWEKSCRVAQTMDPSASDASCRCDPGTTTGRPYCPPGSPGLP